MVDESTPDCRPRQEFLPTGNFHRYAFSRALEFDRLLLDPAASEWSDLGLGERLVLALVEGRNSHLSPIRLRAAALNSAGWDVLTGLFYRILDDTTAFYCSRLINDHIIEYPLFETTLIRRFGLF